MEEKKPVVPTLRNMAVGDVEAWPIERMEVVRNSVNRYMTQNRRSGVRFALRCVEFDVTITRTA
nr:MAG TPA: hypothetical protein [Caudoviricetes sp.]